ncbi:AraC family transcriptional regulator [Chelativorans sp. M5D2P16]|uniref:helix-turn-helix domain-containing protein n=1 Tax=Chelativorans sp. M5D2P16 TaxID=3095678 RepID=UPI002ACA54EE|nr:AraC family transcriptional regulator [Chelativorans sp. M5D2P16]MDZ5698757.1 AraC family transcriptional regulator [Chelativorans sp. M5D2P16]
MPAPDGLYERAAVSPALRPFWHVDEMRTFFVGPLQYNRLHQHGAPVYLAGMYSKFGLRIHGGRWHWCRTAVIPAGVLHELDLAGYPLAVFYVEPSVGGVDALVPLSGDSWEVDGVLVGRSGEFSIMRELWEDSASARWAGQALDDLLAYSKLRAAKRMDPRVSAATDYLRMHSDELTPVMKLARNAGLSASQFQRMFTREVGVPFRRYRAWNRMRVAIREIANGSNFTTAAHAAGFADQAHFTNDFRRTFGAPPSVSLLGLRNTAYHEEGANLSVLAL